jgi:hypothetical protein
MTKGIRLIAAGAALMALFALGVRTGKQTKAAEGREVDRAAITTREILAACSRWYGSGFRRGGRLFMTIRAPWKSDLRTERTTQSSRRSAEN